MVSNPPPPSAHFTKAESLGKLLEQAGVKLPGFHLQTFARALERYNSNTGQLQALLLSGLPQISLPELPPVYEEWNIELEITHELCAFDCYSDKYPIKLPKGGKTTVKELLDIFRDHPRVANKDFSLADLNTYNTKWRPSWSDPDQEVSAANLEDGDSLYIFERCECVG